MCTSRRCRLAPLFVAAISAACAVPATKPVVAPALGRAATPDLVAAWNTSIYQDGRGLPAGGGRADDGRVVYQQKCASCHGREGRGGSGGHLVGSGPLSGDAPDQTVGSYWPYATTVFDFTRRAMPMDAPGSLTPDETYAVTAYLLHLNGIVGADEEMNAQTLPKVSMPNRDGFIWIDARPPESR